MRILLILTLLLPTFSWATVPGSNLSETLKTPESQQLLDLITKSPETLNRVTLKHLGKESQPARIELIKQAQEYVFISVPYWYDDPAGKEFMGLIKEKRKTHPDMDFKILQDWTSPGSTGDLFANKMYRKLRKATGSHIQLWNPIWFQREHSFNILRYRLHDKMMIVDGKSLLMGGLNISREYLEGGMTARGWHDTDVLIEGPAAQEATKYFVKAWELNKYFRGAGHFPINKLLKYEFLQRIFYEDVTSFTWQQLDPEFGRTGHKKPMIDFHAYIPFDRYYTSEFFPTIATSLPGAVPVRLIYDNPLVDRTLPTDPYYGALYAPKKQFSKVMHTFRFLAERSQKSIRIFLPYLTPRNDFLNDLEAAARRGLTVQIITNSLISHDLGRIPYKAAVGHYRRLLEAGVEVYEWQGHKPLLELQNSKGCQIAAGEWPGHTIHSKIALFDDSVALIGSHNFNERSQSMNTEVMALINDGVFSSEVADVFAHDLDENSALQTIQCSGTELPRGRLVEPITIEVLDTKLKKYEEQSGFWKKLQKLM